jgi:predicted peroxiredoxin
MPFHLAMGAIEAGHQPVIALGSEATYLMKDSVAEQIHGVGIPPLLELMQKVIEHGVPIAI